MELYEELYEDGQNYRFQRRAKKRRKAIEYLDKKKKPGISSNSRKTVFIVRLEFEGKEYTFDVPGNKYVGHPDEFKEIKQMAIKKYGEGIMIINIKTR